MSGGADRRLWNPAAEAMSADEMRALQLARLKRQLAYNHANGPFHRERFKAAGARPEDIHSFSDFAQLPLMDKEAHRQPQARGLEEFGDPFALFGCAPREKIVRINATSGTTGEPTLYGLTAHDVGVVNEMHARKYWRAGMRPGGVMLQALSLSMFTGGLPLSQGIQHMGACVVPVGVEGGTARVIQFARLTKPEALIATPSFARHLIEECEKLAGVPARALGIKRFFSAGEAGGGDPEIRAMLAQGLGARIFDHTGGGHAFHAISCDQPPGEFKGLHLVSEDHCLLELVDPDSKAGVEITDGARGEMVWTFLGWEGGPFMRYAMGDVVEIATDPCPCGQPGPRIRIIGRADDMLIVKGVNVYPQAIAGVIAGFRPRITGAFRIVLGKAGPSVSPPLRIRLERGEALAAQDLGALVKEMLERFRAELHIRPRLEWTDPRSLPREAMKTRLVVIEARPGG